MIWPRADYISLRTALPSPALPLTLTLTKCKKGVAYKQRPRRAMMSGGAMPSKGMSLALVSTCSLQRRPRKAPAKLPRWGTPHIEESTRGDPPPEKGGSETGTALRDASRKASSD